MTSNHILDLQVVSAAFFSTAVKLDRSISPLFSGGTLPPGSQVRMTSLHSLIWYQYLTHFFRIFPSLTDTFGIVNIEAIACGTPVAAFPVTGPRDIVTQGVNGYLSDNLHHAIEQALRLKGQVIHTTIEQYTWSNAAQQFLNQLVRIDWTHD